MRDLFIDDIEDTRDKNMTNIKWLKFIFNRWPYVGILDKS